MTPDLDPADELASALTHGAGAAGAVAVLVVLTVLSAGAGNPWMLTGTVIYGATLVLLYLASTAYHTARSPEARRRLRILDHAAIYLLIAGTYTPFTLGVMRGGWGWSLFGVVWGLAVTGMILKVFLAGRFRLASTLVYLGMGWMVLLVLRPLAEALQPGAMGWLVAGGAAYTLGTPFYQRTRFRYAHSVWHLFVLAGSACHAVAVALAI